jgi:predicted alpha-1,2-mannosidase
MRRALQGDEQRTDTRRRRRLLFFSGAALLLLLAIPASILLLTRQSAPPQPRLRSSEPAPPGVLRYVNPLIGTDIAPGDGFLGGFAGGNVFPGASFPHGMVQWSPDTTSAPGGYRYGQSTIHGFSLTHFSGRGCSSYQDFPFMPILASPAISPVAGSLYGSNFSHNDEVATPGYYSVRLDNGIQVALTVTARSGFGIFTYPHASAATMLINASGSATGDAAMGTGVRIIPPDMVIGSATSGHFCGGANTYTVYFAARFDRPFASFGTWNGLALSAGAASSSGSQSGAYVGFAGAGGQRIGIKVGLSFVSSANALLNMEQEDPGWNFNAVRAKAGAAWNTRLDQIQVSGGSDAAKTVFYTALYHTLFHPNIFSDVNGQYIGFDGKIHTARGYTQYENFPGWDMYRSLIGLLAILEPKETGDMLQSLVMDAQQGGGALPRWEVANDNSGGMVGDSDDVVIATSYAFGVRNFDAQAALQAMDRGASQPDAHAGKYHPREGLDDYLSLGYVSTSLSGSAAITLEYATDDFAIARFAQSLGDSTLYADYMQRSHNWQNLFNAASGYIEPRNADGSFIANFSPTSEDGFVESNGLQYSWMVPYDLPALFKAMGGNEKVVRRLDAHFTMLNAGPNSPYAFMGNEPEFEVPWEYDFASAAYRTQDVVRRITTQLFQDIPGGLPGNDDGGAMSSWYVFAALGLYPEIPGVAGFALGSPLFPSITVHLGNGHDLHIIAPGSSQSMRYVQSLSVNGRSYTSAWLPFSAIAQGATLHFTLGSQPERAWGNHV